MFAFLASIGWRELAGKAAANAAGDIRSVGKWLGGLDLVHALLLAACVALAVDHAALLLAHRHSAKVEMQLAASAKALADSRANEATLKKAIANQNAALAALSAKTAQQQQIAVKAENLAAERAQEAQAISDRLKASARAARLKSASPCEPSDALKEQWP